MSRFLLPTCAGLSLFLAYSIGLVAGRVPHVIPPTVIVNDGRPGVPVVRIDGISGREIVGSVSGNARVFLSGRPVLVGSGTFRVPASTVARVSHGAVSGNFVASKRGKKYYKAGTPSAEKLSPGNRVYFETVEQAEAAGYIR